MSLITDSNIRIVLQTLKKLLSFKADKAEVDKKVDKSDFNDDTALSIVVEINMVTPVTDEKGFIFTDKNGEVYSV